MVDLTEEQRSKLWPEGRGQFENSLGLTIPVRGNDGQLDPTGKPWSPRVNPANLSPTALISVWERDYDEALLEVKGRE